MFVVISVVMKQAAKNNDFLESNKL